MQGLPSIKALAKHMQTSKEKNKEEIVKTKRMTIPRIPIVR